VLGTRFLLTPESGAHPDYRERLIRAERTTVTELFGAGWPVPHRVVPNAATERWLRGDPRGPLWLRSLQRATAPALARVPAVVQPRMAGAQRPDLPIFGPAAALADGPDNLLDAGPLYAGESVARISELRPAADLVRELAGP
jgi:nitronate monooxygenase